ncbi:MAG TPA: malto-oligosyltrehalose synthase [Acidimicrobiia bacterium]|nr:malto-oligosyltrehalose synthase [Acidimicrobiia bacterium]
MSTDAGAGDAPPPGRRANPWPLSTYRIQLQPAFGFDDVTAISPYLHRLGISHLYASPYLQAAPGSTHGYDVIDHSRVNAELGGEAGHERMCAALGAAGLGQVLDIVPNHMAITSGNRWWWDVLENGPSSQYASYFDVDWDPPEAKLRNTVLMPILGDHYGRVLEAGELKLQREGGGFTVHYYDHILPVAPRSLDDLLGPAARRCRSIELESLATFFGRLPPSYLTDRASVRERHRDKEVLRQSLARLLREQPPVAAAVDTEVAAVNADPDRLDALLERQNYRLAFWRTAGRELDYRRFFDIHTLAALRMEDEAVFVDTHELVIAWLDRGVVDGLRIDHPDGLRDPEGYLRRLARAVSPNDGGPHPYVVVEKILEPGERLPQSWPVAGTTGYDFTYRVGGLFVDPAGEEPLSEAYTAFTGESVDYDEVVYEKKHLVMSEVLSAEINRLTGLAIDACEHHRRYRDYTRHDLHETLRELIAAFPVYRSYVVPGGAGPSPEDAAHVEEAVKLARGRRPDLDGELFDFFADILLGRHRGTVEDELVARFQQVTGPVMAKGVEDTTFYTYNRLTALNEVGGSPGRFGVSPEEFHDGNEHIAHYWGGTLLATSTHDTKRSEDTRARIALLSEIPREFAEAVARWTVLGRRHRTDPSLPDRNAEWLLYQTLVGAWPLSAERAVAYMEKASKEAKEHTSWVNPDPAYDDALRRFVEGVLADEEFVAAVEGFVTPLVEPGRVNALAQALLKLASPGVPDVYQGCELWDHSLVDPDNRRPVDFGLREGLLAEAEAAAGPAAVWPGRADSGLPKLLLTHRALHLRRRRPELFCVGSGYVPLAAAGPKAAHAVGFARTAADTGEPGAVAVAPRLVLGLAGEWAGTTLGLPEGRFSDVFDGNRTFSGEVRLAELLDPFPVALLERT